MSYSINWDLESIFKGGSSSTDLTKKIIDLGQQGQSFNQNVTSWHPHQDAPVFETFINILNEWTLLMDGLAQVQSFINMIQSADVTDKKTIPLQGKIDSVYTLFKNTDSLFTQKLTEISEDEWTKLIAIPDVADQKIAFNLAEIRKKGKQLLSQKEEIMLNSLATDGFNGWSSHYDTLVASIVVPFTEKNGTITELSAGQAFNRMMSDPDQEVRATLFATWEKVWGEKAPLFADTLNHLNGFRLKNYELHGQQDFLETPLTYNRMKKETLDTMWETIAKNKQPFLDFLTRKAQLFGKEKMDWQDQDAPIILGNLKEKKFSFDEAAAFIIENFNKFSPKMATFAQKAFDKSWIEAEDRPGKRPGGYCTSLPESEESRIFMTYGESINEVSTLAHELGHAFHSDVMWDLPAIRRDYAMNVAETASTFAELIVADATLKEAATPAEKINLLDTKMQNATAMFLNIHARYLFETAYYEKRKTTMLSDDEITSLMLQAQKESYQDSLNSYHPHFWASKLHFYIDDVPFYNFPYTFGYLFSMGIYAYAQKSEGNFEEQYIALLRDTASMTTEELALKHLNVDLTKPDFWQAGIDMVIKDVEEFVTLTEPFLNK